MHVTGNGWIGQERIERIPIRRNEVSQDQPLRFNGRHLLSRFLPVWCALGRRSMLLPLYARFRAVSKGFRLNKPIECPIFPCEVAVNGYHLGCNYFSHVDLLLRCLPVAGRYSLRPVSGKNFFHLAAFPGMGTLLRFGGAAPDSLSRKREEMTPHAKAFSHTAPSPGRLSRLCSCALMRKNSAFQ